MGEEAVRILEQALARRAPLPDDVDAYRVLNGPGDEGPAGLAVDRYGDFAVVWARDAVVDRIASWLTAVERVLRPRGVVLKVLRKPATRSTSTVVMGEVPAEPVVVREEAARFLCELATGVQTGLFLDQREARGLVRECSDSREVLNLFAYTSSFSVQSALGGARRVTSVDVSRRALRVGRENMKVSGLDPNAHRWFDDDVLRHLSRAERTGARYDLVVVDPPVLGHGARTFALDRDLSSVLASCSRILAPGGLLMVSTHARSWSKRRLLEATSAAGRECGRVLELVRSLGLPAWDHPTRSTPVGGPEWVEDRGRYLTTLVLRAR